MRQYAYAAHTANNNVHNVHHSEYHFRHCWALTCWCLDSLAYFSACTSHRNVVRSTGLHEHHLYWKVKYVYVKRMNLPCDWLLEPIIRHTVTMWLPWKYWGLNYRHPVCISLRFNLYCWVKYRRTMCLKLSADLWTGCHIIWVTSSLNGHGTVGRKYYARTRWLLRPCSCENYWPNVCGECFLGLRK